MRAENLGTEWCTEGMGKMGEGKQKRGLQVALGTQCKMSNMST